MTNDIRTEAAVWAEGTKYSTDDIVRAYRAYRAECEERGVDADDIQTFCQRDLEIPNEDATDDNTLLCEATAEQLDRVRAAAIAAGHPGLEDAVNGDGGSTGLWGWTVARVLEHFAPHDREYRIALVMADGEWEVIDTFEAADDDAANAYAEENHADREWYVLDANGRNINGGDQE